MFDKEDIDKISFSEMEVCVAAVIIFLLGLALGGGCNIRLEINSNVSQNPTNSVISTK